MTPVKLGTKSGIGNWRMKSGSLVPFPSRGLEFVLDSWPVMEWLKDGQRVADRFEEFIARALLGEIVIWMSRINLGEVYYSSAREWGRPRAEAIEERLLGMPILYVSATDDEVASAPRVKAVHRISYADAFAGSLAIRKGCPLVSGDENFRALEAAGILRLEWMGA